MNKGQQRRQAPKYALKMSHLLESSNCHKLERDGFTYQDVHRVLYKEAGDATNREREQIISKLYDRQTGEK